MSGFSYENQSSITYLVYALSSDENVDTMSLGMLTNNKIAGFAPAIYTQMDADRFIRYNVSAKITAKQILTGSVNRKRLIGVLKGIVDGILSAEDYMIDTNSILLDLDYIFVDVTSCEAVVICLPIIGAEQEPNDIGNFIKNIMVNTQFDSTENSDHIAKIFNFLNSSPVFSIEEFKKLLGEIDTPAQTEQKQIVETKPINKQPVVQPELPKKPVPNMQPVVGGNPNVLVQSQAAMQPLVAPIPPKQTGGKAQVNVPPTPAQPSVALEKQISWFYLMQHYNKENAATYKAQKAAKKARKQTVQQTPNATFTVPGAPQQPVVLSSPKQQGTNPGFAIPGQVTPAPVSFQTPTAQPAPASTVTTKPVQTPVNRPITPAQPIAPQGQPLNFGETTVLGGGAIGETTVLSASQTPGRPLSPFLIRPKNNEKIAINKPVFRIGKERSYVDYFVGDNTAVSRSHANIVTHDGLYFIVDTNSTNHTYVNGAMIQSNIDTKLNDGDKIRLANEDFEFKLM